MFFALKEAGWLISLRKSTVANPKFVFWGLFWDLDDQSSRIHNDRLHAILHHRTPRSMAELSSQLSTIHYYSSFIPALKRIALPLYQILKNGEFVWDQTAMQAWNNLLYLISLRIRNYIFQPNDPLIGLTDARAVEQSAIVTQWCKKKLLFEDYRREKHNFYNCAEKTVSSA